MAKTLPQVRRPTSSCKAESDSDGSRSVVESSVRYINDLSTHACSISFSFERTCYQVFLILPVGDLNKDHHDLTPRYRP